MSAPPAGDLLGHPRGLAVLFASEAWERFSYFGNAALLVLYLVKHLLDPSRMDGVLGLATLKAALEIVHGPLAPQPLASHIFGLYTGLAYSMPVLGGLVADRVLGQRRTVLIGGVAMAAGHFMMAFEPLLLIALALLIVGIGAFKPSISVQVGALYPGGDGRRERGYSIFYVGINIGAFVAPLVCGALAAAYGWHAGFAAAGVGMLVSLAIYRAGARTLPPDTIAHRSSSPRRPRRLDAKERRAVLALLAVSTLVPLFWAAFDQQGNTILLWAEDFTDRSIALLGRRLDVPASWYLALNPLMIFLLTPVVVRAWAAQDRRRREPRPAIKMAFGCICLALAYLVMALAAIEAGAGSSKASALWLVAYFVLATLGELHVAPVGLALVARLAPAHLRSLLMGVWFAATLPAGILGGTLGALWGGMEKPSFFLLMAATAATGGVAIFLLQRALIREQ
ncbi:MAG: peptide MFS transporter [Hyphomicrobiales bacterium]|nr:peptide MFS transporter [Hyphomicrobiales bacterium]